MTGHIYRRGKSWRLKFDAPPGPDGKRKTRWATFKGTKREAQAELNRLWNAARNGDLPDPTRMTVAQYLESWADNAHALSPKTLERYGELIRNQINPHLGGKPLQRLTPADVQAWHGKLLKGGLSPRTVGHAHRVLSKALGGAVKNKLLNTNVAAVHTAPSVEDVEQVSLTPEQVTPLLAALSGSWLHPIVSLALATGMRRGELLGLQWSDVDLDAGTLRVERSVEETKAGLRLKSPKTRRGRRTISLAADAVAMLRAHKVEQMETRMVLGMGKSAEAPVFTNVNGGLISPHSVSRAWRRMLIAKELPRVPFHALRHAHASMLIRAGIDILTISRRLGHSKASVTLDVYGHLIGGADAAAAKALEGVLK